MPTMTLIEPGTQPGTEAERRGPGTPWAQPALDRPWAGGWEASPIADAGYDDEDEDEDYAFGDDYDDDEEEIFDEFEEGDEEDDADADKAEDDDEL